MAVKKRSRGAKNVNNQSHSSISSNANPETQARSGQYLPAAAPLPAPRIDPQEAARFIKSVPIDPSTQIVRHLAIFRLIIFLLLVQAYVRYLPHSEVNSYIVDPWLTYDQFSFLFDLAPKQGDATAPYLSLSLLTCAVFFGMLSAMGGMNGIPNSFRVCGTLFLGCYAFRFFMFAHTFTDRHYLLFLLGVITVVSGGGSFFLIFTEVDPVMPLEHQQSQRLKRQLLIQSSEWGAVTLRLQYAVVYFFSCLWKLHSDYLQGHILRGYLIGFDEFGTQANSLWSYMEATFGAQFFQVLGLAGFMMDFGLFLVLMFWRPSDETSRSFVVSSLLFHSVVALTVGDKLGYSFSVSCVVGILVFYPIGGGSKVAAEIDSANMDESAIRKRIRSSRISVEANLMQWVHRYVVGSPEARATREQQLFTIVWLLVQLALPLRMPLISNGSYPFTAQGYRFSWTMMLHSRQTTIQHSGKYMTSSIPSAPVAEKPVPLHLFYLLPECSGKTLQRRDYMPDRSEATEDPRTLPIHSILTYHYQLFVRSYPRYMARIAGGLGAVVLYQKGPEVCGGNSLVSVFGVHFAKLNGRGAYCRIFDPTVDLALVETSRLHEPIWETWWGVLFDRATTYEYMFASGIGSMNPQVEMHRAAVEQATTGAQRIEYISDRSACLALRPLALWPNGYPLSIMALEAPQKSELLVTARTHNMDPSANLTITAGNQWDILDPPMTAALKMNKVHSVTAISLEITASLGSTPLDCATSTEDVLFALIFMS